MKTLAVACIFLAVAVTSCVAQSEAKQGGDHQSGVTRRGDQAMGFSHEKTRHHFRLLNDGGAIEVNADDANDTESRNQIRMHLEHISRMFAAGNFDIPMFIHATNPPGVATMKELREQIHYRYQETDLGALVRMQTSNQQAVKAIHEFLRFQISEHQTGDPATVTE